LEQFVLNAFEKAPSWDKTREPDSHREVEGETQSKHIEQVRRRLQDKATERSADGESEFMHRHRLALEKKQVNSNSDYGGSFICYIVSPFIRITNYMLLLNTAAHIV